MAKVVSPPCSSTRSSWCVGGGSAKDAVTFADSPGALLLEDPQSQPDLPEDADGEFKVFAGVRG